VLSTSKTTKNKLKNFLSTKLKNSKKSFYVQFCSQILPNVRPDFQHFSVLARTKEGVTKFDKEMDNMIKKAIVMQIA
jgi:hypothetical protein